MQHWDLTAIEAPDGTRDPAVLHTSDGARAVLISLHPGQALGDHEVTERAWLWVVEGAIEIEAGGERTEAGAGTLATFAPGGAARDPERGRRPDPPAARALAGRRATTAAAAARGSRPPPRL